MVGTCPYDNSFPVVRPMSSKGETGSQRPRICVSVSISVPSVVVLALREWSSHLEDKPSIGYRLVLGRPFIEISNPQLFSSCQNVVGLGISPSISSNLYNCLMKGHDRDDKPLNELTCPPVQVQKTMTKGQIGVQTQDTARRST